MVHGIYTRISTHIYTHICSHVQRHVDTQAKSSADTTGRRRLAPITPRQNCSYAAPVTSSRDCCTRCVYPHVPVACIDHVDRPVETSGANGLCNELNEHGAPCTGESSRWTRMCRHFSHCGAIRISVIECQNCCVVHGPTSSSKSFY